MQSIERAEPQARTISGGELSASFECDQGELTFEPWPSLPICRKHGIHLLGLIMRDALMENGLRQCMRPFRAMQGGEPNPRVFCHVPLRCPGVHVRQVERNQEARIRVDAQ